MTWSTEINPHHQLLWLLSLTGKVILSQTEELVSKTLLKGWLTTKNVKNDVTFFDQSQDAVFTRREEGQLV